MYVKCLRSKKSGKLFYGLFKHLDYKELLVCYDENIIAELLQVSISKLHQFAENEVVEVK